VNVTSTSTYLFVSPKVPAWISWQPLLSLSFDLLAAVQLAGLKKNR
jgi:hypothetical protein